MANIDIQMTDNEMRIAIAEACGYERWGQNGKVVLAKPDLDVAKYWKQCGAFRTTEPVTHCEIGFSQTFQIPNYPEDLNAMHAAEELLIRSLNQDAKYVCALTEIASSQTNIYTKERAAISATARQRAIAFLKTIGKYKE